MKFLDILNLPLALKYRFILFMQPRGSFQSSFNIFIPFLFFITTILKPKKIVQLGVAQKTCYFAFCQIIKQFQYDTTCYGIDNLSNYKKNDQKTIHNKILELNKEYDSFSTFVKSTFDNSANIDHLKDIDILNIAVLKGYEETSKIFDIYLPKMSNKGVILLHFINQKNNDNGVSKFWDNISKKYPNFKLSISEGLGVLMVGKNRNEELKSLSKSENFKDYEQLFKILGSIL